MPQGNFEFMKIISPDLWEELYQVERRARLNISDSGQHSRKALELIVQILCTDHGLTSYSRSMNLGEKLSLLQSEWQLREAGYLAEEEKLADKPICPELGMVQVRYENGDVRNKDYYTFLREFGNACSHTEARPYAPAICYDNVVKCLKGCHQLLRKYYRKRIALDTPVFDEYKMPIDKYDIYDSAVPGDSNRSHCEREFYGYILDSAGEKNFYAILRLYNKAHVTDYFLQRNHKCFSVASKASISSVPQGMTKMYELTPVNSKHTGFYIICYEFNREPFALSDAILKKMTAKQRIRMCSRIADCIYELHTSETPIEHRMLTYESIYTCQVRDEWVPYVIKFDFAKIESPSVMRTVIDNAMKAKDRMKENRINKYLPPEWAVITDIKKVDWRKVDIYSLGILFSDILYGRIHEVPVPLEELEEQGVSDVLLDLLDLMRAEDPASRFAIDDVKEILNEEARG